MASSDAGGRKSPLCLRGDLSNTYGNFFLESTVMAEYAQLLQHPVPSVYVLPSEVSPLIWYGLLSVRGGIYEGAVFKFTILIPANYPDGGCPEFDFQAGVYHPLVDFETGELETKKEFQRWRRDINHIHHLLTFARKIFYNIDTSHAANREAAEFFRSDAEKFKLNVKESIDACLEDIMNYDPSDSHSVKMGKWTMEVMKAARTSIFEPEVITHTLTLLHRKFLERLDVLCEFPRIPLQDQEDGSKVFAGGVLGEKRTDLWSVLGQARLQNCFQQG